MCQRLIAATACGKPDTLSNSWMTFLVSSFFGRLIYVFSKFFTICLQTVCTIEHTVDLLIPKQVSNRPVMTCSTQITQCYSKFDFSWYTFTKCCILF